MKDLPEEVERITLKDGTQLSDQASRAITLYVAEGYSAEQAAKAAGYANAATFRAMLNSERGKEGVGVAALQHLSAGAVIGLKTMITLAKGAKSETVRQLAAADLMNRAGLKAPETDTHKRAGQFSINIAIGGEQQAVTIDATAIEGLEK